MQLNESQKAVVLKLLPRVQHLRWRGLTAAQIKQTLVVAEGWPVGAVEATFERIRQASPSRNKSTGQ